MGESDAAVPAQVFRPTVFIMDDAMTYSLLSSPDESVVDVHPWEGRSIWEVDTPDNALMLAPAIRSALAGQKSSLTIISSLYPGREFDIDVIPLEIAGQPRALLVGYDINESRKAEKELERVRQTFAEVIHESPTGIALADASGRLVLVNDAFCTLFDRPGEALVHRMARDLFPAISPLDENWVTQLVEQGPDRVTEYITIAGDGTGAGEPKRAAVTALVLRDENGVATSILINAWDTSEQHRYHEHLAFTAAHDTLTGLLNRSEFERRLNLHLELCRRSEDCGAVVILDFDNFRQVNDTLGHAAGDEFIIAAAATLNRWATSNDLVARIGGDEFAVLLADGDRDRTETVVRDLVNIMRDSLHIVSNGGPNDPVTRMTVSVGAVAVASARSTASQLLSDADLAMYEAKAAGRNGYRFFSPSQVAAARASTQINWAEKIRSAIENDMLVLHAQPILDVASNEITAFEMLVRMIDDDGSLILPTSFIGVAERSGLAIELDQWVVGHAIDELASLQRCAPHIKLHVNLSGRSVGDCDLAEFVVRRIGETGVDAAGLVLELTETAAVASIDRAQNFMHRLAEHGVVFALDDFGVGFGSFFYLKHLPFGIVKLDGEFVSGTEENPLDRLVVSSLVSIGKGLGKITIAEFVEDAQSLELLRELGIDGAQGHLVGHPAPLSQFYPQLAV